MDIHQFPPKTHDVCCFSPQGHGEDEMHVLSNQLYFSLLHDPQQFEQDDEEWVNAQSTCCEAYKHKLLHIRKQHRDKYFDHLQYHDVSCAAQNGTDSSNIGLRRSMPAIHWTEPAGGVGDEAYNYDVFVLPEVSESTRNSLPVPANRPPKKDQQRRGRFQNGNWPRGDDLTMTVFGKTYNTAYCTYVPGKVSPESSAASARPRGLFGWLDDQKKKVRAIFTGGKSA